MYDLKLLQDFCESNRCLKKCGKCLSEKILGYIKDLKFIPTPDCYKGTKTKTDLRDMKNLVVSCAFKHLKRYTMYVKIMNDLNFIPDNKELSDQDKIYWIDKTGMIKFGIVKDRSLFIEIESDYESECVGRWNMICKKQKKEL